ncbi:MAG: 8-amino-7-oxononanoate synthase [Cellvibrionaceae bacterium]
MLDDELRSALDERRQLHRYRQRLVVSSPPTTHITVDDKQYLGFCSNDYLGLANHPQVIETFRTVAEENGVGSGASHLVCGHSEHHHRLEEALAKFTGRERVLLFSTGYMANLGVISALINRNDTVLEDRLNHASLIDAGLLSRAQFKRFQHNDVEQLDKQLSEAKGRKLVVVDGVFSMDGDLAPLPDLASLCQDRGAHLMIDDAHGFGVLGDSGGGCAEHFQLSQQSLPILVGTLGKAFGTFGAFVAGSEALIETLIQFARPYIYTTALPPAIAAATLTSLSLIESEKNRRVTLQQRIEQFRQGAAEMGLPLMDSFTPIQPVVLGDDALVLTVAELLKEAGILIGAIRPPTVPEGTARLRITFSAEHSEEDVARLLASLETAIPVSVRSSNSSNNRDLV